MIKKALILDSGILINLSMNGLLYILKEIKKTFKGGIFITKEVKYEVVDRPINIQRFEFEAIRIQNLIDTGVLELPESLGISDDAIKESTESLLDKANHFLQVNGQWIRIVSSAEVSCLALSDECNSRGIETLIGIDERTLRLLAEKPEGLERLMSEKLHQRVRLIASDFGIFSKYRFIRSSELAYVAYKKDLLGVEGKKVLEAVLYATKFKGTAISFEEIDELKKL